MVLEMKAVYENGTLKLKEPLPLQEHEKVQVTIQPVASRLLQSYGIMGFAGTAEEADYFAMDPELDYPSPAENE